MVSVIIPTYNRAHLIGRAIESVRKQTFHAWECVVVDDASTDTTALTVENVNDPRLRFIQHRTNRGGSAARNTGLRAARGQYVAFLDSDDEWLPCKLREQLAVFARGPRNLGAVVAGYKIGSHERGWRTESMRLRGNVYENLLGYEQRVLSSVIMVRRSRDGTFPQFDEDLPAYQDWDFFLKISRWWRFDYVDRPLCLYHLHEDARISSVRSNNAKAREQILGKYAQELKARPKIHARHYVIKGRSHWRDGDLRHAREAFLISAKLWPWNGKTWALWMATFAGSRVFSTVYRNYTDLSRLRNLLGM